MHPSRFPKIWMGKFVGLRWYWSRRGVRGRDGNVCVCVCRKKEIEFEITLIHKGSGIWRGISCVCVRVRACCIEHSAAYVSSVAGLPWWDMDFELCGLSFGYRPKDFSHLGRRLKDAKTNLTTSK
jgi:hypothetical protein